MGMKDVYDLAPKMALQYQELAKAGKADKVGSINSLGLHSFYEFYRGNQAICLVCLDPPCGHVRQLTPHERQELNKK